MKYIVYLSLLVLTVIGCKKEVKEETLVEIEIQADLELDELINLMTGSFSSKRQATIDTNYREVLLHMYPIWPEREGTWMYVEQSLASNQEEPHRQQIYKISRENDSVLRTDIYHIPNADLWICKWQTPESFDILLVESIQQKLGCELLLMKTSENTFKGKTNDKNCTSEISETLYTTSELEISKHSLTSRESGFDENDSLVWSTKKDGYVFDKIRQ